MMTDSQDIQGPEGPPETFVKQVKDVLKHVYDLSYLQHHPLAQELCLGVSFEAAGQRLRRELVAAIDVLSPEQGIPFRAPEARLHSVLVLHYMERMTIQETAYELAVSPRQVLRNLRQAEESVVVVLWGRRSALFSEESSAAQLSSFQAEMAHLKTRPHLTDVRLLIRRAQEAVGPRAVQRGVIFGIEAPEEPVTLSTNRMMAQQVLISALSHAVGQARPGDLHLMLSAGTGEEQASLTLHYAWDPEAAGDPAVSPTATQLAERLGWTIRQEDESGGIRAVTLYMTARCPAVLIIDDNEGLVNLLERYLTDRACQVITAANGQEGWQLAQTTLPDAIVLDVMMPAMDGWEVLQRLRNDPQTADIPVVVCSVVIEPDLARALRASLFLPKPVRRVDVLDALRQLGVV
jgi:CheY-like chemotaxis protein